MTQRAEIGMPAFLKPKVCAFGDTIKKGELYASENKFTLRGGKIIPGANIVLCAWHFKIVTGMTLQPWDHPEGDDCGTRRRG